MTMRLGGSAPTRAAGQVESTRPFGASAVT